MPYEWALIGDDVTGKPARFELTCAGPVTVRVWLSRGNSQNLFTRSMVFPAGTTVIDIPNNVANRVVVLDDDGVGDYWIEVGA